MAKYTEYLKLVKPEGNEYYSVEQFNQNAEMIDKETKKLSEDLAKVQEGATREKAGIVQLGTGEGKALEGIMLARMFGCVGYGGDIQEPGVKDINYIYYDRNTRKMYKCLNQNSDVSANVANFIPLDNNSLLDRLENLNKVIYFNKSKINSEKDANTKINGDFGNLKKLEIYTADYDGYTRLNVFYPIANLYTDDFSNSKAYIYQSKSVLEVTLNPNQIILNTLVGNIRVYKIIGMYN